MSDDDHAPEAAARPIAVDETNLLFRLTPVANDLSKASRQIAIVAAATESEARRIATAADPLGGDWGDTPLYVSDSIETRDWHVVGDTIFRSRPTTTFTNRFGKAS